MIFALLLALFGYLDQIFESIGFSWHFRFSIVGLTTSNADFQDISKFWVSSYHPLYFFKEQYQASFHLKMSAFICPYHTHWLDFVIFFRKPTNLCCQRFHWYWVEFPLLLPRCIIIVNYGIWVFKRTLNHAHSPPRSWDIFKKYPMFVF